MIAAHGALIEALGQELWITSRTATAVDVVDITTNRRIATIPVGTTADPDPHGLVMGR